MLQSNGELGPLLDLKKATGQCNATAISSLSPMGMMGAMMNVGSNIVSVKLLYSCKLINIHSEMTRTGDKWHDFLLG